MLYDETIKEVINEPYIIETILHEPGLQRQETVYFQTKTIEKQLRKENQLIKEGLERLREELSETLEQREDESRNMENLVNELKEQSKVVEKLRTENQQLQEDIKNEHWQRVRERKVAELFDNGVNLERMRRGG